ncbi:MAG: hypothetical protein INR62_00195 [Rhodospirillales bacterium]|nr:hypothetical protein [Acetobacter sp.]
MRVLAVALCLLPVVAGRLRAEEEKSAPARAPLGATPQQIGVLYGPVLKHNARVRRHQILEGGTVIDGDLYSRNGLVIRVVFHAGIAVLLEYTRVEGPLTEHDANLLLAANADASTWEAGKDNTEINRYYRRADGKAVAHYATEYDGSLLIASEGNGTDFYGGKLIEGH